MALSAHLEGVLNGILLVSLGTAWAHVLLPRVFRLVALVSAVAGAFLNWAATELAALWGTSSFTPIAAGHGGLAYQEKLVSIMLMAVGVTMLLAITLIMFGFWRSRGFKPGVD